MDLAEFVSKYIGKKVDFDGAYGAQCVGLFRQYSRDVLNINEHTGAVDGAKDLYLQYKKMPIEQKYFEALNALAKPEAGDIAIWAESATNRYGHVAIVIGTQPASLLVFEQNGLTQAGAELKTRSKDKLLGYLRRRR